MFVLKINYMVKSKPIQIVQHFDGGCEVYQDTIAIKWEDFKKTGVRNKKDRKSGKWFRVLVLN